MKMYRISLLLMSLLTLSTAEKFVKIEGTSGKISQIVIDSDGRWYIVKDKSLYYSFDKGVKLNKIEIPSKESVFPNVGIDDFHNIYVQDYNLTVFLVAPGLGTTFIFEKIELAYGKEKIVSKPFARYSNTVYLATKSGLMYLDNGDTVCKKMSVPPSSRKEITHLIHYNYGNPNREGMFFSGGNPRYWVYKQLGLSTDPIVQTKSFVKFMGEGFAYVYFTINGEKEVYVTQGRVTSYVEPVVGIDASNIDDQTDFVVYSRINNYKTYIYSNINNTGTIYGLREKIPNKIIEVVSTHQLQNERIICGSVENSRIYFGTSDGVYELMGIQI